MTTIPATEPDNPLILGQTVHTGIEKSLKEAIREYCFSFPIITDEHINEIIKFETVIPLARAAIPPGGQFEVEIKDDDFHGFIDYLVPARTEQRLNGENQEIPDVFDLYDFKYSNNVSGYKQSGQLHEYKYFFERNNPGKKIRNMYFVFIPKVTIRQKKTETLLEFRERLKEALSGVEVKTVQIGFNPEKVIEFLFGIKAVNEETEFPQEKSYLCRYCEFQEYCEKGNEEVKAVDADVEGYLKRLQEMLINHTYQTSPYEKFIKHDSGKDREIFKLPYFPDRICQWAILQVIEPYLMRHMTKNTYSALPKRGIHAALHDVQDAMWKDVPNCQYCLKLDVRHYYPSINHDILKAKFRRLFKDSELLWLLDEIIDSICTANIEDIRDLWFFDEDVDEETGIPIGNYLSQYCGNFYLSDFDHWIKEEKRVKHYFRYMDDIVIFGSSKEELHALKREIDVYFMRELRLTIKGNWQVFPSYVRGVDFVGYRTFLNYTLLRKSSCTNFKKKMVAIREKTASGQMMNYSEWCSVNSYKGWLKHCDSYRLRKKYIAPIQDDADRYYRDVVKTKKYKRKAA